jgi:hypothetical protein
MKLYYYVYRSDEERGPKIKHASLVSAQAEAERLASQHPSSAFEILECVAVTRCTVPKTFWMDKEKNKEPKYRFLAKGERILDGDQYWSPEDQIWKIRIPSLPEEFVPSCHLPHRRLL